MEEARAVFAQLRSLDAMARENAPAEAVLGEIHALLQLLERWLEVEPAARDDVDPLLERCRGAVAGGAEEVVRV